MIKFIIKWAIIIVLMVVTYVTARILFGDSFFAGWLASSLVPIIIESINLMVYSERGTR